MADLRIDKNYPGVDQVEPVLTTNLTITLPFTLDGTPPASRADRLFLIATALQ